MAATTPFGLMATFKALLQAALLPDNQEEFRLLVTGKTGQGKSALVNGLLGKCVAVEGCGAWRCTTQVTEYKGELLGVPVTVFDSLGLQDITEKEDEYIADMKKKCQNLSLVLYCTKMIKIRLSDDDKHAMLKLTASFGQRFWEHAVLVLTFANMENVSRRDERDEDEGPEPDYDDDDGWKELEKKRFEGRLEKWKHFFHEFLINEVRVTRDIVEKIPVVPAGDHRITRGNMKPLCLPDRENWFDEFWKACSLRMREKSYQLRELEHNIEIQAEERKRKELEKQAEEYKKKIDEYNRLEEKKMAKESDLLDKKPQKSDLLRIFNSSAAHYMIIGTALDVEVGDLLPTPGATTSNLIHVFKRWLDIDNDTTWRKILKVCEDYPELGQAKTRLKRFFHEKRP